MAKSRVVMLILTLLVSFLCGFITFFLGMKGLLDIKLFGLTRIEWFFLLLILIMLYAVIYDIFSIYISKKKFGEIRFHLKRRTKKVQVFAFIFLCAVLVFEVIVNFIVIKEFTFINCAMILMFSMMTLMFGYHNFLKEGIANHCIYLWGSAIKWGCVKSYYLKDDVLIFEVEKKVLGMTEKINIPFIIEKDQENAIRSYVSSIFN